MTDNAHVLSAWEANGTAGMMMAGLGVIEQNPGASDDEIRTALEGNLCRCTGYQNIVASVRAAADAMARS